MSGSRPVIGISAQPFRVRKPFGMLDYQGVAATFVDAIARAGGVGVILPATAEAASALHVLDGILLSGGGDIDPARYGDIDGVASDVDPIRDAAEIELVRRAVAGRLPVLGVCRGLQVINVALGGTLRTVGGHLLPGGSHPIHVEPDTLLAEILCDDQTPVNSLHHQAIGRLGRHLRVCAIAGDGTVEAIESTMPDAFVLGVQWHPELIAHASAQSLFDRFVAAATRAPARSL